MKSAAILVRALWDDEEKVWCAASNDIAGLAVEASTMELLEINVKAAIPDLIELNGIDSHLPEIPLHIISELMSCIPNPKIKS